MNQEKKQNQKKPKKQKNCLIEIVSVLALTYLIFSLISPMLLAEKKQPRKIETPDIIVITIILLFNSGLLNRLEDFAISKEGGVSARFKELKQEVDEQKKQIDELQEQQLEQLQKQQKNLEEMQAFMYNFLLGEKDYEKIDQLEKNCQAKTSYNFYVSERVGDELRRLRDLKLIDLNSGYISDVVQASENGRRPIDLTQYLHVTELGKKYLITRETLHSSNQQDTINSQVISKAE
jgi:flagellar basal body-associated protein FliL